MSTSITPIKRQKIYGITGGKCFYCGCDLDVDNFHLDHFTPKSKEGKIKENLVPACPDCNYIKANKTIEEFRMTISNYLVNDTHVRMIDKYCGIKRKSIEFYFEKQGINII